jgi:hypothetical protein
MALFFIIVVVFVFIIIFSLLSQTKPKKNSPDGNPETLNNEANSRPEIDSEIMPLVKWLCEEASRQTKVKIWEDNLALKRIIEASHKGLAELEENEEFEVNLPFLAVSKSVPKHFSTIINRKKCKELEIKIGTGTQ